MDLNLHLPDEVVEAFGPEPEREALEGVLLLLVQEGRMSLERAGEILGSEDREEAARWYAERLTDASSTLRPRISSWRWPGPCSLGARLPT